MDNSQAYAEDPNAQLQGEDAINDAELFGSGSEDNADDNTRELDDEDLDSGDDEDHHDREDQPAAPPREENVLDVSIGRHAIPQPSDGEVSCGHPYQAKLY